MPLNEFMFNVLAFFQQGNDSMHYINAFVLTSLQQKLIFENES